MAKDRLTKASGTCSIMTVFLQAANRGCAALRFVNLNMTQKVISRQLKVWIDNSNK